MLMYVRGVVLLRNFPFVGEIRLTVLTRFSLLIWRDWEVTKYR